MLAVPPLRPLLGCEPPQVAGSTEQARSPLFLAGKAVPAPRFLLTTRTYPRIFWMESGRFMSKVAWR